MFIMDIIRRRSIVLFLVFFFLFSTQNYFILSLGTMNIICKPTERRALLSFKQHLNDSSNRLSSWSGENCCSWVGVHCHNKTDHVIHLHLHDFGLGGELNPSLHELKQLRHLDLSLNNFDGIRIPDFLGSLQSLRYLNLSEAGFSGMIPHQLGNLSNLHYLDFSSFFFGNRFTIVDNFQWISHLSSLKYLDLSYAIIENVSSNFHWISHLSSLEHLDLSGVNLKNASDFQWISHISTLKYLDLSYAIIENASDLQWISHLSSLEHLDLSGVNLKNASDFQWISHISALKYLDLSYAIIENASDLQWISHLSFLEHLDLSFVNLGNAYSNWFHVVNMLPSLLVLRLSECSLSSGADLPTSLSHVNFTSLQVLDLSYNYNYLNSTLLPEWLYSLTNLQQLDLRWNSFQGTISPSIGNLTKLTLLHLSNNDFEGTIPASVGNLTKLTLLDLSYNQLSGLLPDQLGRLENLEYLSLAKNSFSGSIPFSMGRLTLLKDLDLSRNELNGSIPFSIGRLTSLKDLVLSENELNESVPESFGNLSKLETLFLSYNSLEGNVSQGLLSNLTSLQGIELDSLVLKVSPEWIPPFQLRRAELRNCGLGPRFPNWLRTQKHLKRLDLSSNGISGTVPIWFWNLSSQFYYLNLSHNHFNGELPKVLLKGSLGSIDLNSNKFKGPLPRLLSGVEELYLSNNSFSGPISTFLCNPPISENNNFLYTLDLSDNLLSGNLSECWVYWTFLQMLNLGGNKITGKIPSSIGSLLHLETLQLGNNKLSGELPSSMRNITFLSSIDLGGNGLTGRLPIWLGKSFPLLTFLRLRSNKFYDEIPREFCHLASIRVLDIAHNDLRGSIPRCFNNFSSIDMKQILFSVNFSDRVPTTVVTKGRQVEYNSIISEYVTSLDLSKNCLSGEIPEELTSLIGLISLNLSDNRFTGKIPEKIGNMYSLESLDFSKNRISGVIPQSISNLSFLGVLDLSYNNLSGKIPSATQLQTFNMSSYIGNQELCGPPLNKNCSTEDPPQKHGDIGDRADEDEDWFEMKLFYMSMGVGFVFGFWVFCGVMVLKRSWRIAYFRFLDDTKDKLCLLF